MAIHHEIANHLGSLGNVVMHLSQVTEAPGTLAQIDVYICAILSNGTGAGSFIDMAYLLKDQIRRAGAVPSMVGVLVDASVVADFNRSQKKKEQALLNGYAALRELEFWMKVNQPFLFDYNNHSLIEDPNFNPTSSVFDYCFLIQTQNEQGKSLPDFNDYIDVTAEALFHLVGSSVRHLTGSRWLDSITAIISSSRYNGMSTSYASFGVVQLSFPIEQVTDYCAYELGEEIIALLTTPPREPQKFKQV